MTTHTSTLLLRRALLGNATFSILCGLALLLGGGALAPRLGIPALALRLVGAGLLPFAAGLIRNARRPQVDRGEAWTAVVLDVTWVMGSAFLVIGDLWPMTEAGSWAVLGVAEVVLGWAVLQAVGLRRPASSRQRPTS